MVKRWLTTLLVVAFSLPALAAVTANVDRSRLYDDETLELIIRADFPVADRPLDLTALSQVFDIVHQRQSTQTRYSTRDGRQQWREWILTLRPKRVGTLAIPPFEFGDERTESITVTVLDSDTRRDGLDEDAVVLSARVADESLYIGQTTTLTIELDYQVRLQGNFETLSLDDFDAELVDENNSIQNNQGRQVRRYTLVYRLTPTESGVATVPDIVFSGQYQAGQFDTMRRLTRRHPGFSLTVKPVPDAFPDGAHWLPATSVSLDDNLPQTLTLDANEHLDWTITTRVGGLSATQLPDPLAGFEDTDFRLYRNAPEFNDEAPLAQRKDLSALVFTEPGEYRLPAVRLPWWNLTTDRLEYAELPPRSVEVRPDPNAIAQPSEPAGSDTPPTEAVEPSAHVWPWVALSLGIGWLTTALVWIASRRHRPVAATPAPAVAPESAPGLAERARNGSPMAFYAGLSAWLQREHGTALTSLAGGLPEDARRILRRLETSLYSPTGGEPPSSAERLALLKAVESAVRPAKPSGSKDPGRLYP